jgi:uncharacterized protein (TIGR03086 family)
MPASLLASAIDYALGSVDHVAPELLGQPTPCREWDLAALLRHANDSVAALYQGLASGYVSVDRAGAAEPAAATPGSLAGTFRDRAARLRAAAGTGGQYDIAIASQHAAAAVVTAVGALEIAVHGWDVAAACGLGRSRPIPADLARSMLEIVPLVVTDATRGSQFATPVAVPPPYGPSDRLLALLGRDPAGMSNRT